ncbi:MAG: hypothetical protein ACOCSN_05970 [Halanaeroarchaeum sp.]
MSDHEPLGAGDHEWEVWAVDADNDENNDYETGTLSVTREAEEPAPPVTSEPIGWVSFERTGDGDVGMVPVFSTEWVDYPCWRVGLPGGYKGAFQLVPRHEASHPMWSIDIRGTIFAIHDEGYEHPGSDPYEPDEPDEPSGDDELVDDFDHSLGPYRGDTSNYTISSDWDYKEGASLLHRSSEVTGGVIESYSDLDNYPEEGDRITYYWRTNIGTPSLDSSNPDHRVYHRLRFGCQNEDEFYAATINIRDGQWILSEKPENGAWTNVAVRTGDPIPGGRRMRTEIAWGDQEPEYGTGMSMRVWDDESNTPLGSWVNGEPQSLDVSSGGIAWNHTVLNSNVRLYTDYIWREPIEEQL